MFHINHLGELAQVDAFFIPYLLATEYLRNQGNARQAILSKLEATRILPTQRLSITAHRSRDVALSPYAHWTSNVIRSRGEVHGTKA